MTIRANGVATTSANTWQGDASTIAFDEAGIQAALRNLDQPCYVVRQGERIGVTNQGASVPNTNGATSGMTLIAMAFPLRPQQLGDPAFRQAHGVDYAYMGGAMANSIASEEFVIALNQGGFLGSYGAAGVVPQRLEGVIQRLKAAIPNDAYGFNLIHSPHEPELERRAVDLYLQYGVRMVEASAYLDLTPEIVRYRANGLSVDQQGNIHMANRVMIKLSRAEVATKFIQPPPQTMLQELVQQGAITQHQAELAARLPVADDVTTEADSGGHTDNRPLVSLLPSIISLRDQFQAQYQFATPVRVGAAGGIGTPESALAAFMLGAAYVVTGSINQACVEAGASEHTRKLLAQADMADVSMAPSANMFEMGVKVQVLKRGTMFPMRAQKLYEIYQEYPSIEAIPQKEREKLEKQVFRRNLDDIWADTVNFFEERDPAQIERANNNPKRKMALIFRWYLGLSSRWSNAGEQGREVDYQIWCGPSMGAFNAWTRGTYLEQPENRRVADVAKQIMTGAAYLYRMQSLQLQGAVFPTALNHYHPG